jgi:hypothetical protein
MKRKGAARVHKLTKGMTFEEEVKFWNEQSRKLIEEQKKLKDKSRGKPHRPIHAD